MSVATLSSLRPRVTVFWVVRQCGFAPDLPLSQFLAGPTDTMGGGHRSFSLHTEGFEVFHLMAGFFGDQRNRPMMAMSSMVMGVNRMLKTQQLFEHDFECFWVGCVLFSFGLNQIEQNGLTIGVWIFRDI